MVLVFSIDKRTEALQGNNMSAVNENFKNIGVISPAEEAACFKIYRTDPRPEIRRGAMMKIVRGHIPFVISVASKYHAKNMDMEEFVDEGILGMINAVTSYDPSRGVKFLSYAVWYVMQAIQDAIYKKSHTISLPLIRITQATKVAKRIRNGMTPDEALADMPNKTEIIDAIHAMDLVSINVPVNYERNYHFPLSDFISAENMDKIKRVSAAKETLHEIIKRLDSRARRIIESYYGLTPDEPGNLRVIGEEFGINRETVRSIKNRTLRKLREMIKAHDLEALSASNRTNSRPTVWDEKFRQLFRETCGPCPA
jgi:RNA polymerase primary sigma factor